MIKRGTDRTGQRQPRPSRRPSRPLLRRLGRGAAALAALSQVLLVILHLPIAVPKSGSGIPSLYLSLCTTFAQSSLDPASESPAGRKQPTGVCPICLLTHNAGFFPTLVALVPAAPGGGTRLDIAVAPSTAAASVDWPRPFARAPPA